MSTTNTSMQATLDARKRLAPGIGRHYFASIARHTLGLTGESGDAMLSELGRFMFLYALTKDGGVREEEPHLEPMSPPLALDTLWHNCILETALYKRACRRLAGRMVHHRISNTYTLTSEEKEKRRHNYFVQHIKHFGMPSMTEQEQRRRKPARGFTCVFLKTLTGKTLTMPATPKTTIEELSHMYEARGGPPADDQRFIYAGQQLERGRTLLDYRQFSILATRCGKPKSFQCRESCRCGMSVFIVCVDQRMSAVWVAFASWT
ncbi:ubiquitin [Salpingoeca rosetta]|uniref:Ubiquitin n=1 Tax=Salpingoeca rosetta (strain ATCC 50818 / BSB-021) TaxID=946362 RepID=F2U3L9_SALR5|nr:ubiquitin [Salpingoeca rosetta]EGD82213.1 ubiquitin [Salpingoeca rosetta]|eukprot:XP_004996396.1 ubiquitin [Salpingoeca rosetta]